jgi:hypothetical protein
VSIPHLYKGHDKTFFFVDYEGNRRTTAIAQQFLVPTAAERDGDLRSLGVNTQIPTSSINPTAKALLAYYPLPSSSSPPMISASSPFSRTLREVPAGRGSQFLNNSRLAGGWELTNVTVLETEPWLTPSISGSFDQSNTNVVNRGATLRPDAVSKAYGGRGCGQYLKPLLPLLLALAASVMQELAFSRDQALQRSRLAWRRTSRSLSARSCASSPPSPTF